MKARLNTALMHWDYSVPLLTPASNEHEFVRCANSFIVCAPFVDVKVGKKSLPTLPNFYSLSLT